MKKKIAYVIVFISAALIVMLFCANLYDLISKSYYIDETKLYKIDTFHLLNKAYEVSDNSGSKTTSSHSQLTFQSVDGYSFEIEANALEAIPQKQQLEGTLMYHDTKFIAYSTKEYYDQYKKREAPFFIKVYQIQIGDKKYIDINKWNATNKRQTIFWTLAPLTIIILFLLMIWKGRTKKRSK